MGHSYESFCIFVFSLLASLANAQILSELEKEYARDFAHISVCDYEMGEGYNKALLHLRPYISNKEFETEFDLAIRDLEQATKIDFFMDCGMRVFDINKRFAPIVSGNLIVVD